MHYTEENVSADTMMKDNQQASQLSPPVNCGIYIFSVRFYEEVGFSSISHDEYDNESINAVVTPKSAMTYHSVDSEPHKEVITQHQL